VISDKVCKWQICSSLARCKFLLTRVDPDIFQTSSKTVVCVVCVSDFSMYTIVIGILGNELVHTVDETNSKFLKN